MSMTEAIGRMQGIQSMIAELSRPAAAETSAAAAKAAQADARARNLAPIVAQMQAAGCRSLASYAAALTARGLPSPSGRGPWHRSGVARLLRRLEIAA